MHFHCLIISLIEEDLFMWHWGLNSRLSHILNMCSFYIKSYRQCTFQLEHETPAMFHAANDKVLYLGPSYHLPVSLKLQQVTKSLYCSAKSHSLQLFTKVWSYRFISITVNTSATQSPYTLQDTHTAYHTEDISLLFVKSNSKYITNKEMS